MHLDASYAASGTSWSAVAAASPEVEAQRLGFWPFVDKGAQGRSRTTDTAIFSRMLYQLSYLGTGRGGVVAQPRRAIKRVQARIRAISE